MKKLFTTITRNGKEKTVFPVVDDATAKALEQVPDKTFVSQYIYDEYKLQMQERKHARMTQSLDKSMESGFDVVDERFDLEQMVIDGERNEKLFRAIKSLQPQQQWLIEQIYFEGRKQRDVADELDIDETAISHRLSRILVRLKKIIEKISD